MIPWGFVAALGIVAFAGWESHRDTVRVAEAASARRQSYEVQRMIDQTVARLVDAETGQRGYLLTGNEAYLEPYRRAIGSLGSTMGQLKDLTSDNPNQRKRMQALEPLVEKKLAELQTTINLRKSKGLAAATRVVAGGSGKQWMDQIRAVLAEMADEESDLRTIRTQERNKALAAANRAVVGGSLLSILLLSLVFSILLRELSERKRVQGTLAKREQWFSTTLGSIGDAVIATDLNGTVTFMNSVAQSLTGWRLEDAQGKSMDAVFNVVDKETRRPAETPVKKVFLEGKVVGLTDHTLLISKDGKEFDIEDSAAPIVTEAGGNIGVVLVFRDITQKKRAEDETKRQKELLQLILESIADGVVVADSNGKFLLFNAAAERIVGIGATDTAPDQWSDHYGSYLPDAVTPYPPNEVPLVRAMRGESVDAAEIFIRNAKVPDGRLLSVTGRPLRGEDGALRGGVAVFCDVTKRKQAEEALRASEQRLNLALDAAQLGIWELDLVNDKAYRNLRHDQIFGYESLQPDWGQEIFLTHVVPEDRESVKKSFEKAFASGDFGMECRIIWADKSIHWISAKGRVFRNAKGDPVRMMGTVADVTERKRAEEAIVQAKEEAERASKFKDQFLSTMSHELRTPLNAILGFSELLTDKRYGEMNERQSRYVNHIHTSGKHLLKLISDILDLSKIEAGRMEIVREDVAVDSVCAEVLSALQPLADKKSQTLVRHVEPNLCVRADPTRFKHPHEPDRQCD